MAGRCLPDQRIRIDAMLDETRHFQPAQGIAIQSFRAGSSGHDSPLRKQMQDVGTAVGTQPTQLNKFTKIQHIIRSMWRDMRDPDENYTYSIALDDPT